MNTLDYRKTGLPGLSGTHDKASPIRWAFLAKIPALIAKVAKVGAKVGKTVAKVAPKVAQAVKTGAQAVKTGAQTVGKAVKTGAQAVGQAGKFVGEKVGKGAKQFAGKGGFVSRTIDAGEKFAKNNPMATKAILGGVGQMKSGIDRGKAEIEQSVYANKQNEKENRSNFASMNFGGGGPLSKRAPMRAGQTGGQIIRRERHMV